MAGIVTLIPVSITIDDVDFNVTARDPSKKELEAINAPLAGFFEEEEIYKEVVYELEMLKREFTLNKQMSAESSATDKMSLFVENKKLNREIFTKNKERDTLRKGLDKHDKEFAKAHEKRFDLVISGDDKEKLRDKIINSSISFNELFEYIAKTVAAEREKK